MDLIWKSNFFTTRVLVLKLNCLTPKILVFNRKNKRRYSGASIIIAEHTYDTEEVYCLYGHTSGRAGAQQNVSTHPLNNRLRKDTRRRTTSPTLTCFITPLPRWKQPMNPCLSAPRENGVVFTFV